MKTLFFVTALAVLSGNLVTEASELKPSGNVPHGVDANTLRDCESKIAVKCKIIGKDSWYGFRRIKFDFSGRTAWVVEPSVATANGCPWTWTMQWADAFVDRTGVLDLLKQGYHHVTIDLFDTRMNEEGLKTAAAFQEYLVKELGFAPKVNLVGMSWGGFFSTRYAATYPDHVRKIYLDAPLLNFTRLYVKDPKQIGKGNPEMIGTWKIAVPMDHNWDNNPDMPINLTGKIAAAKIPVLLLYGGQDQTVAPEKNSEIFIERFKAAGGDIKVIKRNLFGHHPHGVDPDKTEPIVKFFAE